MMPRKLNLAGKKFGRLTAISEAGCNAKGHILWRCKCDCGNTKLVVAGRLGKQVNSCGCRAEDNRRSYYGVHIDGGTIEDLEDLVR